MYNPTFNLLLYSKPTALTNVFAVTIPHKNGSLTTENPR